MRNLIITVLLFVSTLTYSQTEKFSMTPDEFPESLVYAEWCGTEDFDTRACYFLIYVDKRFEIIEGNVVYRKFYNKENRKDVYWDIDHFTDLYNDPFTYTLEIVGFKLK